MVDGQSYDGMSTGLLAPGDLTGDGLADVLIATEARGVLLLEGSQTRYDYDGIDSTTLAGWDNPDAGASQENPNGFGTFMAAGDVDNDGVNEVFIAGHLMDGAGAAAGNVYLFDPSDGDLFDVDATFSGDATNQNLGVGLATGFDVNTDGIHDLIIAGREDPGTWQLFIYYGSNSPMTGVYTPSDADAVLEGPMDGLDDPIALGQAPDLNGDGAPELLIGLPMYGEQDEGTAYMLMSRVQWNGVGFESAEVEFQASTGLGAEHMGWAVGNAGNVVGQEGDDIYIAAQGYDGSGGGYGRVLLFGADEHSWMGSLTAAQAESHLYASRANDFGAAVVPLGSIELDEFDDIAVMATDHELDEAGYGALFIIRGRQGGFPADHHQGDNSCHYVAEDNNYMGPRVVLAGDMDGDEYPDLVVGDYLSGWGDGRVYVVYTPESPLED
jgi:hypothetical protein